MRQEYFLLNLIFPRVTLHKCDKMGPIYPVLFVFLLRMEAKFLFLFLGFTYIYMFFHFMRSLKGKLFRNQIK